MAFAFGRETREKALRNIANLRSFQATRGGRGEGLEGIAGPYRRLTNVRYGALPREYAVGLDDAQYVVYCYGTPIAWVTMADDATEEGRVNYMPDWQYSATTTYYQGLVHQAWGDGVVDPRPEYSREQNRGTDRGRSADVRYGRAPAPDGRVVSGSRLLRTVGSSSRSSGLVTNHRGVQYDPAVERDTSFERDMVEARSSGPVPQSTLLDPRYSDPDWIPPEFDRPPLERMYRHDPADDRRHPAHP